jgi:hypothetical protein
VRRIGSDGYRCTNCGCGWTRQEQAKFFGKFEREPGYEQFDELPFVSHVENGVPVLQGRENRGDREISHYPRPDNDTRFSARDRAFYTRALDTYENSGTRIDKRNIKALMDLLYPDGRPLEYAGDNNGEPIRAWKNAEMTWKPWSNNHNTPQFQGIGSLKSYEAVDIAHCEHSHPVPFQACMCGFWAYKSISAIHQLSNRQMILRVDLYGKVLEGETGYRAEKQRVMAIYIPSYQPPYELAEMLYKQANMLAHHYNLELHTYDSILDIPFSGENPSNGTVEQR